MGLETLVAITAVTTLVTSAVGAGLSATAKREEAKASNKAAEYNAQISERNAEIAELQAVDAEKRGVIAESQHRLRMARLVGSQRVSAAGSGVVVDEGSPLEILQDADRFGELDALTIRANAAREAWGFRTQVGDFTSRAALARATKGDPELAFGTSLLSGVSRLGSQFVGFANVGAFG